MAAGGCLEPMPLALYRTPAPITQGSHHGNTLPAGVTLSLITTTAPTNWQQALPGIRSNNPGQITRMVVGRQAALDKSKETPLKSITLVSSKSSTAIPCCKLRVVPLE
jgi:hypothetical protein